MTGKWFNLCTPNYFHDTEFYCAMRILKLHFTLYAYRSASTVANPKRNDFFYRFIKSDV